MNNNDWNLTWAIIWGVVAILALVGMRWNFLQVFNFFIAICFSIMFINDYRRGKGDDED